MLHNHQYNQPYGDEQVTEITWTHFECDPIKDPGLDQDGNDNHHPE